MWEKLALGVGAFVLLAAVARGAGKLRASAPYYAEIMRASQNTRADALLLAALASVESSFRPNASNPSDPSWGLCGITPAAAAQVRGRSPSLAELTDPYWSLETAGLYLAWMSRSYGFTFPADIGAYNVGPTAYRSGASAAAAAAYQARVLAAMKALKE